MTTFDEFIEATALYVSGFTGNQDQLTHLANPVTTSALTVDVADGTVVPEGTIIEINSELMWVESVDANELTIAPFGRGYRGTTAAAHSVGDRVTVAPPVPRSMIERAVNDTIRSVWPTVFGTGTTEFTFTAAVDTYALPAAAERVLSVSYESIGPTGEWLPVRRWRVDQNGTSGNTLSIYDTVIPGQTVRVVYTQLPASIGSGDDFTDSGLRDSCQDLVQFGAAARLVPWLDVGTAPGVAAEPNYTAAVRGQGGSATSIARYFTQMYQLRLQEEAAALQHLFPVRSHYTR